MIRIYKVLLDKPFAVVWEFGGQIWSNTFRYVGECEEGVQYFDPFSVERDGYSPERRCEAFFLKYPHKLYAIED